MRWLSRLRMRVEMLFRRGRAADRLDDELRFHVEQQIAENVAGGWMKKRRGMRLCGSSGIRRR